MNPDVAPEGTVTPRKAEPAMKKLAGTPLIVTLCTFTKLPPRSVIESPARPLNGLKLQITGPAPGVIAKMSGLWPVPAELETWIRPQPGVPPGTVAIRLFDVLTLKPAGWPAIVT